MRITRPQLTTLDETDEFYVTRQPPGDKGILRPHRTSGRTVHDVFSSAVYLPTTQSCVECSRPPWTGTATGYSVRSPVSSGAWTARTPSTPTSRCLGATTGSSASSPAHYAAVCDAFMATISGIPGRCLDRRGAGRLAERVRPRLKDNDQRQPSDDARDTPPWWLGEVLAHDMRGPDLAVLSVRPDQPFPYQRGPVREPAMRPLATSMAEHSPSRTRLAQTACSSFMCERFRAAGSAARSSITPNPVTHCCSAPPLAQWSPTPDPHRDVLCVAGGTGLAPIKAIVQQLVRGTAAAGRADAIFTSFSVPAAKLVSTTCLHCAGWNLAHPALRVIPVVSDEPEFGGLRGKLPDVVGRYAAARAG